MMPRPYTTVLGIAAVLACLGAAPLPASAEWIPYLENKKGESEPFPENPATLKDKDWLAVRYPQYSGFKPRLGVTVSEDKQAATQEYANEWARLISSLSKHPGQATNPYNHIEDLVRAALGATNRFTMVERTTAIDDVLDEQDLGASGRVDKKTSAKIGKVKGSQFVVKATIIELNPEKEAREIKAVGGALGARTLGIAGVGLSGKVAFCRLNVRVIDSETSEIVKDMIVDGTAKSSGLSVGGGLLGAVGGGLAGGGVGTSSKKEAPISDAMQSCANKVAYHVAQSFEDLPWQGAVALVKETGVTITGGTNVGLKVGHELVLMSKGEEITDPETNEVIDVEVTTIGKVRVVSVTEKTATCEIVEGGNGVKRGDIVKLVKGQVAKSQ